MLETMCRLLEFTHLSDLIQYNVEETNFVSFFSFGTDSRLTLLWSLWSQSPYLDLPDYLSVIQLMYSECLISARYFSRSWRYSSEQEKQDAVFFFFLPVLCMMEAGHHRGQVRRLRWLIYKLLPMVKLYLLLLLTQYHHFNKNNTTGIWICIHLNACVCTLDNPALLFLHFGF